MKQCIALAGVVCLALSGCAQNGFLAGRNGQPAHVTRSMSAPRPQSRRMVGRPNASGVAQANYDESIPIDSYQSYDSYDTYGGACDVDGYCDAGCCDDVCCGDGCGNGCCNSKSCAQRWGEACDCMREGYGRWDQRANCFVGGMASGFCPHGGGYPRQPQFNPGPPTGQVAYPYYTTRGPRDFLQDNPSSIGPY